MIPELFTFDITKKELVINRIELLTNKVFYKLITEHNDDEVTLLQIFAYIYWHSSIFSPGILEGLTGETLSDHAKTALGIPLDWEADKIVLDCIVEYKKGTASVHQEILEELLISLNNTKDGIKLINHGMQTLLTNLKSQTVLDLKNVNELLAFNKSINDVLKALPDNINKVTELLDNLVETDKGRIAGRGGQSITNSMLQE